MTCMVGNKAHARWPAIPWLTTSREDKAGHLKRICVRQLAGASGGLTFHAQASSRAMAADSRRGSAELPPLPPPRPLPSRRPSSELPVSRRASGELVHPALEDIDPSTRFLYTPHTITGLVIGARTAFTKLVCCSMPPYLFGLLIAPKLWERGHLARMWKLHVCADRAALEHSFFSALRPVAKHGADACRAGVILLVYFSRTLGPPAPASENLQTAYFNVRHGIIAAALVYLGALQQANACCWHLDIYIVVDPNLACAPSEVTWAEI
jgi:hypothetical protein